MVATCAHPDCGARFSQRTGRGQPWQYCERHRDPHIGTLVELHRELFGGA